MAVYWIPRHHISNYCKRKGGHLSGRLLDFGCGSKPYSKLFSGVDDYVGLELDRGLPLGESYMKDGRVFYNGRILPFGDSSFDAVVSFQVLEHVEDLESVLNELVRVAKPGAQFLLTAPLLWPEHECPYDHRRFTRWGVRNVLESAGLSSITVHPLGSVYDVIMVFYLDYLNTHRRSAFRQMAPLLAPIFNFFSGFLNRFDGWANREDRYCYLDLAVHATKPHDSTGRCIAWPRNN